MEAMDAFILFALVVGGFVVASLGWSVKQRRNDARFTKSCRRCGSTLPGFARFCRQCGEPA